MTTLLIGCTGPQSALDPAGPNATALHHLGIAMYVGAAAVTLLVSALMLYPFVRRTPQPVNARAFLWGGGVALPSVAIGALVPYVLLSGAEIRRPTSPDQVSIDVTGFVYWWEVAYRRADGSHIALTANELRIPAGEPVELFLRADDVIHSFWVPSLAGKTDMIPGRVNRMVIQADRPGRWRGQCAEYCGAQHALMAFEVIALPRSEFDAWLAGLAQSAAEPASAEHRRGRELFVANGCGSCHAVRGLSVARLGPDLTEIGNRRLLGAGSFPNNAGTLGGWISATQHLKPGARMPSYGQLSGPELRALVDWLASLKPAAAP